MKLAQQYLELGSAKHWRYCVGAARGKPPRGLRFRQPQWMTAHLADDVFDVHGVPSGPGGAAIRCCWIQGALGRLAETAGDLGRIVAILEENQYRTGRGARSDRVDAAARDTRLYCALKPSIAFETGDAEARATGHHRMDRQDGGLAHPA
jgi:hypothetical protein